MDEREIRRKGGGIMAVCKYCALFSKCFDKSGEGCRDFTLLSPFINDMFSMVYYAFDRLYPLKPVRIWWNANIPNADDGAERAGLTSWNEDGTIDVDISAKLTVADAVEILAHELAHVAAGENEGHGEKWEQAFDAIHAEFDRIGNELFPDDPGTAVNVQSGKDYVRDEERGAEE